MASASSVSTSKISGTKANTVIVDEWTEWNPALKPKPAPPVYLDFNTPPLALVIAMQDAGKEPYEIVQTLVGLGSKPHISSIEAISSEHQALAQKIYSHFEKKYTMRRLKNEYISKFMTTVEELCQNKKRIEKETVTALVKLPEFYNVNLKLESLMKSHTSFKESNLSYLAFNDTVEFVDSVRVKTRRRDEEHYYWRTSKNRLMLVVLTRGEYGKSAWDMMAKHGRIHISSQNSYIINIPGYDYYVVQPSPTSMEITLV